MVITLIIGSYIGNLLHLYTPNRLLLRFSIACGLQNSKLNRQMRFSLPSIKWSAAPPSLRPCYLNCAQRFDLITAHSVVVASKEEPPNIWVTAAKNAFVGWALNFGVRKLLKSAVRSSSGSQLQVPPSNLKTYGDRAFSVCAPKLWNCFLTILGVAPVSVPLSHPWKLIFLNVSILFSSSIAKRFRTFV